VVPQSVPEPQADPNLVVPQSVPKHTPVPPAPTPQPVPVPPAPEHTSVPPAPEPVRPDTPDLPFPEQKQQESPSHAHSKAATSKPTVPVKHDQVKQGMNAVADPEAAKAMAAKQHELMMKAKQRRDSNATLQPADSPKAGGHHHGTEGVIKAAQKYATIDANTSAKTPIVASTSPGQKGKSQSTGVGAG
jgi:hypothetical protein